MIVKELFARLGLSIDEAAFKRGDAMIAALSKSFVAFGTAALAGVAVAMVGLTKSTANAADHFKKLSQSTGVDSIVLQEYAYSADLAGVSNDELAHGLQHLAKSGVKDVRAEVLKLADRFKKMPDDGRKVELAMDKFGRAGARMIPWLNGGAKGIAELAQEAHDLGIVFDTDAQNASEEFNDNITRLGYAFAGLRNVIGNALMPVLNKLVLGMLAFVKLVRVNWHPIVVKVTLALRTLAFVMGGALLAALVLNISTIATAVSWYGALGIAAVIAGLKAAAAWALAALPAAALAAAFAAMLLILEDVYVWLQGGDSLIGEMLPKWNAFIDAFMQHKASEPYWLFWLREAAALIERMTVLPRVLAMIGAGYLQSENGQPAKNFATPAGVFGGGSSPAAAAAVSSTTNNKKQISAQQINHVTVHAAPSMNAQDVANKVTEQLDAHFDAQIRKAAAGVQ